MDTRSSGKIGLFTIAYYVSTTVIAILVGFALVFIIKPGLHGTLASSDTQSDDFHAPSTVDMFHDLIKNLFPDNIVSAAIQSTYTLYVKEEFIDVEKESPEKSMHQNVTNTFYRESNSTPLVEPDGGNTTDQSSSIWTAKAVYKPGLNILGILVYCAVFGAMLGKLGHKGRVVFKFFEVLNEITMGMVRIVMWFSPLGILSLITGKILSVSDLAGMVYRLWMFIATCITGLFVQSVVIIPLIYLILTRKNPFRVSLGIVHALLTALGTDSSLSATLASIGAAAVPGSVIAIIMTFLMSMGLPTNELYIILAMDWFLGRLRTVTNVNGDCMAAALLQHFFNQDGNNGPTSENNPLREDEGQLETIQSFV
ncbi:excitatory amino acid transporter-like isoform X2 [Haliotis rufescens]|uniref:excitatory amino acid transporter-like isoform X2 n=1 Tax=Haliotis rufescens TaxID=6454 RepID=UPI00201ECEF6|nr:excitatory amino acid transporter-like isoform X2 [Haliotis rufescens]